MSIAGGIRNLLVLVDVSTIKKLTIQEIRAGIHHFHL